MHQIEMKDGDGWKPVYGTSTPTLASAKEWLDTLDPDRKSFRINPEFEAAEAAPV